MSKDIQVYLEDIVDSIEKIETYVKGFSFEDFSKNTERQDAVIRRLEVLGEAVKSIPAELRNQYATIPWKQIAGMRDILIHDYANVSLKRVWNVLTGELAPLKEAVQNMLNQK